LIEETTKGIPEWIDLGNKEGREEGRGKREEGKKERKRGPYPKLSSSSASAPKKSSVVQSCTAPQNGA
jgi:hypothetical protein